MSALDILSEDEQFIVNTVHDFIDKDVRASAMSSSTPTPTPRTSSSR